jgi:hypothetical protein
MEAQTEELIVKVTFFFKRKVKKNIFKLLLLLILSCKFFFL